MADRLKCKYLFLIFLLLSSLIFAESIEELEERLKKTEGFEKAQILNRLGKEYDGKSFETMRKYSEQALEILETSNADRKVLSLEKSRSYQHIGWSFYSEAKYQLCESYLNKALEENKISENLQDRASVLNLFGALYAKQNSSEKAEEYYRSALDIYLRLNDREGIPKIYNNLGIIYKKKADYSKALDYYLKSLKIHEDAQNLTMMASSYNNVAILYKQLNKNDLALEYYKKSLDLNEKLKNRRGTALSYNNIAALYFDEGKNESALEYYSKSLELRHELKDREGTAILLRNIADVQRKLGRLSEAVKLLNETIVLRRELRKDEPVLDIYSLLIETYIDSNELGRAEQNLLLAEKEIPKSKDKETLKAFYKTASLLSEKKGKTKEALQYFKKYFEMDKSIYNESLQEQFAQMQTKYESEKKQKENEILKKQTEIQKLNIERQSIVIVCTVIGLILLLTLAVLIYRGYREKKKDNEIIAAEKEKSEKLLLNILPEAVAADLKENGSTLPRIFNNVTVFFSDIVTFTDISSRMEPDVLISELNELFTAFDDIIEKNGCERIKTIGDAYLAVCGMPEENENHAENMIRAAKEIIQYLTKRNENGSFQWKIRVGIHSGKVVGGVVGVKKYIYDVFGDTINTCSRMESNSLPMKINVSEETYSTVKDKFNFTRRKPQEVKGKGKVRMYFVE